MLIMLCSYILIWKKVVRRDDSRQMGDVKETVDPGPWSEGNVVIGADP